MVRHGWLHNPLMFIKKLFKSFSPLVFLLAIVALLYFYIPKSVVEMDKRVEESNPNVLDEKRLILSSDLETFMAKGLPVIPDKSPTIFHYIIGNHRKWTEIRIKRAIEEIKNTEIETGKIRIWSIMNMGVVAKTKNHIIAFDTSDITLSLVQKKIANIADVILITHGDPDHYDPILLKKALDNGKKVVLPKNFGFVFGNENYPNLMELEYDKETEIEGVKITAFQTDHRGDGNFMEPNAWYLVEVDGFTLLHTGDGMNFKNSKAKENLGKNYNIDIFLANRKLNAYDTRDVSPEVLVPLHLYKFVHNREELNESTFKHVLNTYNQYTKELIGIDIKLLFTGESFEFVK